MQSESALREELAKIEEELAKPFARDQVLTRISEIMGVAGAASDGSRANFLIGQIYEALLPLRDRARLEARRQRLIGEIKSLPSRTQGG